MLEIYVLVLAGIANMVVFEISRRNMVFVKQIRREIIEHHTQLVELINNADNNRTIRTRSPIVRKRYR